MGEEHLQVVSDGLILRGILQSPPEGPWPLVVLCHGFLSHKQGSKYRRLAQVLAETGIASLRFDFRGCGESEGAFPESTVSRRWRDLKRVLALARSLRGFDGRLGLFGSSLGGYLALLEASGNTTVRCLVVWSTPSHLGGLQQRLPEEMQASLPPGFHGKLLRPRLLPRLPKVQRLLVVHGEQDRLVPREHALEIFAAVREPKSLKFLTEADHSFSEDRARERALGLSLEWFRRHL
jgi:fermentation-respiration switch protein FrsA (DUF1100 family)